MNYKPLPFYLTIKKSKIHGLGLHSLTKIPKDTTIGMTHIEIENDLIRTPLGGFVNHSEEPNCERKQHNNNNKLDRNHLETNFTHLRNHTINHEE